jgi:KaiC domain protein
MKRASTGIEALDKALEGGIPQGSWVVATGEPGVGKSILCIHFAYAGLRAGDPVVYVTTEQEFRDVMEQAKQLGMDLSKHAVYNIAWRKEPEELPEIVVIDIFGLLKVARQLTEKSKQESPEKVRRYAALSIDTLIEAVNEAYEILAVAKEQGPPERHVRLVIDSMSAFWVDKPAMARKYSYQLKIAAHRDNVTAMLTSQYAPTTRQTFGFGLEHIADGTVHMWMDDVETAKEIRRWLIIKKMRMTNHATRAFKVKIEPGKGIVLEGA